MQQMNARFKVWHRGDWVTLTLKPDQERTIAEGGPHEEGYSFCYNTYHWDADQGAVLLHVYSGGQDCDGYTEQSYSLACPYTKLRTPGHRKSHWFWIDKDADLYYEYEEREAGRRPVWERVGDARCYDQYAESMGY